MQLSAGAPPLWGQFPPPVCLLLAITPGTHPPSCPLILWTLSTPHPKLNSSPMTPPLRELSRAPTNSNDWWRKQLPFAEPPLCTLYLPCLLSSSPPFSKVSAFSMWRRFSDLQVTWLLSVKLGFEPGSLSLCHLLTTTLVDTLHYANNANAKQAW